MTIDSREAPGDLALVRAFINTREKDPDREEIASPEALRAWLVEMGLLDREAPVSAADVELAQRLREALRELLLANNHGGSPPLAALQALDEASQQSGLRVVFDAEGVPSLEPAAQGAAGVFGRLLAIVYDARREGTWSRLKACREDTCQWAFYDRSKNSSRHWCSMEVCGSRSKARSYRRRHAGAPQGGDA
jgi:predicted RNA-binding Zn ribbon-like protein